MDTFEIACFPRGVALIASPCILPVLPLMLSTSVEVAGDVRMELSSDLSLRSAHLYLLSRRIVQVLHIDLDAIKYASLVLLFLLVLLCCRKNCQRNSAV